MSKIITNFEIKNLTKAEELLDSIFNGEAPPVEALAVNYVLTNTKLETAFGNILNCLTLTENTFVYGTVILTLMKCIMIGQWKILQLTITATSYR